MFRRISLFAFMGLLAASPANAAVNVITFLNATSVSQNGAFALDAGSNNYALGVICGGATATLGATVAQCAEVNSSGQLAIFGPVTNAGTFAVQPTASALGGASTTGNIVPNNTTAVVIKASAGTLYGVQLASIGSAAAYLKIYNATSATCGTGTPVKRLMIPAASTPANGGGSNVSFGAAGISFSTGITYCVTTGIADADTTAPAASTFLVNLDWQ